MNASDIARSLQARSIFQYEKNKLAVTKPSCDILTCGPLSQECAPKFPDYAYGYLFIEGRQYYCQPATVPINPILNTLIKTTFMYVLNPNNGSNIKFRIFDPDTVLWSALVDTGNSAGDYYTPGNETDAGMFVLEFNPQDEADYELKVFSADTTITKVFSVPVEASFEYRTGYDMILYSYGSTGSYTYILYKAQTNTTITTSLTGDLSSGREILDGYFFITYENSTNNYKFYKWTIGTAEPTLLADNVINYSIYDGSAFSRQTFGLTYDADENISKFFYVNQNGIYNTYTFTPGIYESQDFGGFGIVDVSFNQPYFYMVANNLDTVRMDIFIFDLNDVSNPSYVSIPYNSLDYYYYADSDARDLTGKNNCFAVFSYNQDSSYLRQGTLAYWVPGDGFNTIAYDTNGSLFFDIILTSLGICIYENAYSTDQPQIRFVDLSANESTYPFNFLYQSTQYYSSAYGLDNYAVMFLKNAGTGQTRYIHFNCIDQTIGSGNTTDNNLPQETITNGDALVSYDNVGAISYFIDGTFTQPATNTYKLVPIGSQTNGNNILYGIGPTTNQYFVIKAGGKFEYTLSGYDLRYYDNDTIRMINDYLVIPITETGSRGTIIIADASGDTWTFEDDTSYISSSLRNTDRYIWLYFNDGSSGWSVVFDMQTKTFSTKLQETNTSDYRTISNYIYSN